MMSFDNYKCPKAFNASFVEDQSSCANNCKSELQKCGKWDPGVCYDFCGDKGVVKDPKLSSSYAKARLCAKKHAKDPGIQCENNIQKCCDQDTLCKSSAQICCTPNCLFSSDICGPSSNCPEITHHGSGHQGSGGTKGYGSEDGCFINQGGECSKVCESCTDCEDCKFFTCYKTADNCEQSLSQKKSKSDSSGGNKSNDTQRAQSANTLASQASDFVKSTHGKIIIAVTAFLILTLIGIVIYYVTHHSAAPLPVTVPAVNFYRY
jgi:hypothetical protein